MYPVSILFFTSPLTFPHPSAFSAIPPPVFPRRKVILTEPMPSFTSLFPLPVQPTPLTSIPAIVSPSPQLQVIWIYTPRRVALMPNKDITPRHLLILRPKQHPAHSMSQPRFPQEEKHPVPRLRQVVDPQPTPRLRANGHLFQKPFLHVDHP